MLCRGSTFLLLIGALNLACATRVIERQVYLKDHVTATLRHQTEHGVPIDRGYRHPVEISAERLQQILAAITIRSGRDDQVVEAPAIPRTLLNPIAKGLSRSLSLATSKEEIALTAVRRERRFGIFTDKFLTSFVSFVNGDQLSISFSRIEWDIDRSKLSHAKRGRLPRPHLGDQVMDFRIVASQTYEAVGDQTVRVRWSDARWDQPDAPAKDAEAEVEAEAE